MTYMHIVLVISVRLANPTYKYRISYISASRTIGYRRRIFPTTSTHLLYRMTTTMWYNSTHNLLG
jgi:hypothetical protein